MIQRIQTVYLFLSAICSGLAFVFPFAGLVTESKTFAYRAWAVLGEGADVAFLTWPVAVLVGLVALLNLAAIFLYSNRPLQNRLNVFAMLLSVAVSPLAYFYGSMAAEKLAAKMQYGVAFVLPVISLILIFLAFKAISKDEEKVRSLERLR